MAFESADPLCVCKRESTLRIHAGAFECARPCSNKADSVCGQRRR